ncbi:MAG: cob(I)yrinic acid a,c-diamide adenosyltransferase [Candidatus Krumholzibacteriia bacterium]
MARIYTRTGDRGETSLLGGARVPKADLRVALYGGVDECNSVLGLAIAIAAREARTAGPGADGPLPARLPALLDRLAGLQAQLFDLGAILADPARSERLAREGAPPLAAATAALEALIDELEADLPPLRAFILPGGGEAAAACHVARAVCRRVERRAVAAAAAGVVVPGETVVYLNRLSDCLFVTARWLGRAFGAPEVPWRQAWPPAAGESGP